MTQPTPSPAPMAPPRRSAGPATIKASSHAWAERSSCRTESNKKFSFGIYAGGPTEWVDADGYLPAQITTFIGLRAESGHHRVRRSDRARRPFLRRGLQPGRRSPTKQTRPIAADPEPSSGLVPSPRRPTRSARTARQCTTTSWRWTSSATTTHGRRRGRWRRPESFDQHFAHMKCVLERATGNRSPRVHVPDAQLIDAYRAASSRRRSPGAETT